MRLGGFEVGARDPLFLISGPCVIESAALCEEVAGRMLEITRALGIPYVFKASFDKANRSSRSSFRGPGLEAGLAVLADIRSRFGVPVLTDVHEDTPLAEVASVVDVLQTPAFLCRQTNFIVAVASQGNNLVSDMRSLAVMRRTGCPVVFDATHSVQLPGGQGSASGGQREFVPVLARAAVAAGVAGVFMETHPDPARALSDGPNAWPLDRMPALLETLAGLDRIAKSRPFEEDQP
jgi:2-dehydro-3-deoxyphosphooctonate aldolase (KDO 8-P synthase)